MATLIPWTTVEIGDLDVFAPALPTLVVYTWYVDQEPESTVTFFWRDDDTGATQYELLLVAPVTFEEAVSHAREQAPTRKVEKIHVKHARTAQKPQTAAKTKPAAKAGAARPKPAAKAGAARTKKPAPAKAKAAKGTKKRA